MNYFLPRIQNCQLIIKFLIPFLRLHKPLRFIVYFVESTTILNEKKKSFSSGNSMLNFLIKVLNKISYYQSSSPNIIITKFRMGSKQKKTIFTILYPYCLMEHYILQNNDFYCEIRCPTKVFSTNHDFTDVSKFVHK